MGDIIALTGTKYGCCSACSVHIDGNAERSCSIMVGDAVGKKIMTIEAVSGAVAEAAKTAWQRLECRPMWLLPVRANHVGH
jgi:isoquinoline 1-oxidoreductase alpha subunit